MGTPSKNGTPGAGIAREQAAGLSTFSLLSAGRRTISIAFWATTTSAMAMSPPSLDDLRQRIDDIDDQLHDLIMRRAETVEAVATTKQHSRIAAIRPGREAIILRRLAERHRGRFPRTVLVRLWREIFSGTVMMQGDFIVAVSTLEAMPDYWDLARDHYGSYTPMIAFRSVGEVLRALAERRAAVGVLPMPADGERQPWWPLLAVAGAAAPRILARLPFIARGNARGDSGLDALVVGHGEADPTDADRSLIALETTGGMSRARLIDVLNSAGLPVTFLTMHEPGSGGDAWCLVEIDDKVSDGDQRLRQALAALGDKIARARSLGSYAKPFAPTALG
jgi:chorismate mutase / prephenate dehydratase